MRFKIQIVIDEGEEQTLVEEIVSLDKNITELDCIGLSLAESKQILTKLQQVIVQSQATKFIESNRHFPCCLKQRGLKGYR